jgi:peptide deformylase
VDHLDGVLFTSKIEGETLSQEEFDKMIENQNDKQER